MFADMQMARGEIPGGYNLAVGEPVILQQHLHMGKLEVKGPYPYPTMDGDSNLVRALWTHHFQDHEIVITNGAKQALSAAFYAFYRVKQLSGVVHAAPYWPSYPTLARMQGMVFSKDVVEGYQNGYIHCITSPNNPDGRVATSMGTCDIWDGAYAHPVYGWQRSHTPRYIVAIGSAAKLLGLSGLRVGWLATKDKELAQAARQYVELSTSGVSLASQQLVAQALWWQNGDWLAKREYELARKDILDNGDAFRYYISPYCVDVRGVPATGTGMFAYFKVKPEIDFDAVLKKAKVVLVSGSACGEIEKGWYRMSMGHNRQYTEAALGAIKGSMP